MKLTSQMVEKGNVLFILAIYPTLKFSILRRLETRGGVVIRTVINGLTFDGATKDPMQQAVSDALIVFMAATAQANAEAIKEAQRGGIALAKAKAGETKYRGRKPTFGKDQLETVRSMLGQSAGVWQIASATGLSRQTIYRIKEDPTGAEASPTHWST